MMKEETFRIMGVDVNRSWDFKNGDVTLVNKDNNIRQSIFNRISCKLGSLSWFYTKYGSNIDEYLGELNNNNIHEYIRLELLETLKQDPRFRNIYLNVKKDEKDFNVCNCELELRFKNGDIYNFNFIIRGDNEWQISELLSA